MACPDCASTATTRRKGRTALGYRRFRCQACRRRFNERTGTPFNDKFSISCAFCYLLAVYEYYRL